MLYCQQDNSESQQYQGIASKQIIRIIASYLISVGSTSRFGLQTKLATMAAVRWSTTA